MYKKIISIILVVLLAVLVIPATALAEPSVEQKSITIFATANGTVTSDKEMAIPGETVSLTITPNEGFMLKSISILDKFDEMPVALNEDNTFVMPTYKVFIRAEFEKEDSDGTTNELAEADGKIVFENPVPDDCVLDIREGGLPQSYTEKSGVVAKVFEVSVFRMNQPYGLSDNQMTISIKLPQELAEYDDYTVSYIDEQENISETHSAVFAENTLEFTSVHTGRFLLEMQNDDIPLNPDEYIIGDSDLSKAVDINDATDIQKHVADLAQLNNEQLIAADANEDISVDIKDATIIQKFIADIETNTRCGETVKKQP